MVLFKEKHIPRISFASSVAIVLLLVGILGGMLINEKRKDFKKNLQWIETTYTAQQKELLKRDVTREVHHINILRKSAEAKLKRQLIQRVSQVHTLSSKLYELNRSLGPEKLQTMIRETLASIRFNRGRGYFFILSSDKQLILYPPEREREGVLPTREWKVLSKSLDEKFWDEGQGFISYQWPKPGQEKKAFSKITYVKLFKPYGWIIGTGEYLYDFEKNLQQDIISHLNILVPDRNVSEYIFLYKRHKKGDKDEFITILVNPNRPELVGQQFTALSQDDKAFMFRKEMLKGIEEKGEVFVPYAYQKPGHQGLFPKLSYFKYLPEWDWIVAKGVYLDDLESQITRMQSDLYQEIKQTIGFLTLFIVVICGFFLGLAYLFSKGVGKLFQDYKKEQKAQQKKLEHLNSMLEIQAHTDPLTQIYNRAFFNTQLKKEISRAKRYNKVLGLIIFDIDNFKQVNDTTGHLSGDRILKAITDLCQKNIRTSDIFARWGGEEFVVLVPESPEQATAALAEKLRRGIEDADFSIESTITCSFGITEYKANEDKDEFIHRADKALYHSKQAGKNRVTIL
jgi:diguanylate cyclase (GGDEF)-like protein